MTKIVNTLNLKIPPRELKSKDTRNLLSLIFGQWLSLSTCTIQAVIDVIPPPSKAQAIRMPKMLYPDLVVTGKKVKKAGEEGEGETEGEGEVEAKNELEKDLYGCRDGEDANVVAYVSKMFAVEEGELPERKRKPMSAEEMRERGRELRMLKEGLERMDIGSENGNEDGNGEALGVKESEQKKEGEGDKGTVILGFARLYSGQLRVGSSLYCVLPKYNQALGPKHPRNANHVVKAKVDALYVMMGRDLEPVDCVRAGNVFALRGLEGKVWRHATLCAPGAKGVIGEDVEANRSCLINLGGIIRPVGSSEVWVDWY